MSSADSNIEISERIVHNRNDSVCYYYISLQCFVCTSIGIALARNASYFMKGNQYEIAHCVTIAFK